MNYQPGKPFPAFKGSAFMNGSIIEDYTLPKDRAFYLFFYPLDFTFVCPTELWAFSEASKDFQERGVELIAASVDSAHAHMAWAGIPRNRGGIEGIEFPLISDMQNQLSQELGILNEKGVTYRASYFVDKDGIIRHLIMNDLGIGRSVDETLRIIDAYNHYMQHGEVCPANWHKGDKAIVPNAAGMKNYLGTTSAH